MNNEILEKIDEIMEALEQDADIKKMKELKHHILANSHLMNKIEKVKRMSSYSDEYVKLKKEIMENEDFKEYKRIEKKLNQIVNIINKRLNDLVKEQE